MAIKIKSFSTLRISVADVLQSADWYCALFDIESAERTQEFASFRIKGIQLDIAHADEKSPVTNGGCVGYWLVDDLTEVLKKVEQLGGKIYRGPLKVEVTQRTILQVKDPFGNILGFESPF